MQAGHGEFLGFTRSTKAVVKATDTGLKPVSAMVAMYKAERTGSTA